MLDGFHSPKLRKTTGLAKKQGGRSSPARTARFYLQFLEKDLVFRRYNIIFYFFTEKAEYLLPERKKCDIININIKRLTMGIIEIKQEISIFERSIDLECQKLNELWQTHH